MSIGTGIVVATAMVLLVGLGVGCAAILWLRKIRNDAIREFERKRAMRRKSFEDGGVVHAPDIAAPRGLRSTLN